MFATIGDQVPAVEVLKVWKHLVDSTIRPHPWERAFRSCGIGGQQMHTGRRCLRMLHLPEAPPITSALLGLLQLQSCTSSGCMLRLGLCFKFADSEQGARDRERPTAARTENPIRSTRIGSRIARCHAPHSCGMSERRRGPRAGRAKLEPGQLLGAMGRSVRRFR